MQREGSRRGGMQGEGRRAFQAGEGCRGKGAGPSRRGGMQRKESRAFQAGRNAEGREQGLPGEERCRGEGTAPKALLGGEEGRVEGTGLSRQTCIFVKISDFNSLGYL